MRVVVHLPGLTLNRPLLDWRAALQSTTPTFTCVTCQQERPDSERSPRARTRCKKCQTGFVSDGARRRREAWYAYRDAHPEETRECPGCAEVKPLAQYATRGSRCHECHNAASAGKRKAWREHRKARRAETNRAYYERNREKVLARQKERRAENSEEMAEYARRYYQEHKSHLLALERQRREANPDTFRERDRAWRVANADKVNENSTRYRARRRGSSDVESGVSWRTVAARDGMACTYCGIICDEQDGHHILARDGANRWVCGPTYPTIDHVVPVSKGGAHTMANVVLACLTCNKRKGARPK